MLCIKLPEQSLVTSLTKFRSSYLKLDDAKENILLSSFYVHFAKRRNKCEEYHYKTCWNIGDHSMDRSLSVLTEWSTRNSSWKEWNLCTWWFVARALNNIEIFYKSSNLAFWFIDDMALISRDMRFFLTVFAYLLNLPRAFIGISTIYVWHLSQIKYPSKNIFCHDSGFVLFICKSWVIQSFEVWCHLGWMALSPGYLVPSLLVWIMQPVTGKQPTCMRLPLSLKYPVNVSKSLGTRRMWLLFSWFFLHNSSTVQLSD